MATESIKEKIDQIVQLCEELKSEAESHFGNPLTETEIEQWENTHAQAIPSQFKEWLMFSGECYIMETLARFYLPKQSEYIPENYFLIGELIGDGEKACFSKTDQRIITIDHGEEEIYESFSELLDRVIEILEIEKEDVE